MPPEGVRRSSRIPKQMDILLVGSDTEGKVFSEKTKTVLLSKHGAGIVSRYKLSAEQELILRRLDTNKEAEVRVVGQIGVESDVYTYGVAFMDSTHNFWGIQFPVPSEAERQTRVVVLECGGCLSRETVEQSDLESDVYLVNEALSATARNAAHPRSGSARRRTPKKRSREWWRWCKAARSVGLMKRKRRLLRLS